MKPKPISFLLTVLVIAIVGFSLISVPVAASVWKLTTSYPTTIDQQSCVVNGGYIYCVGGYNPSPTTAVYYAKLSSTGVGVWKKTTSYPTTIGLQSCVVSGGYVYCVGGVVTSAVYYAKLTPTGIPASGPGSWKKTTSYPTSILDQSCVVIAGTVFCIGGASPNPTSAVNYATLSAGGVSSWTPATSYPYPIPIESQSCVEMTDNPSNIWCVGGYNGNTGLVTSTVGVFALGSWCGVTCGLSYPTPIASQSCVISGVDVYCVGGYNGSADTNAVYIFPT